MIMGIDPGRDKCGVAVLTAAGEIKYQQVVMTKDLGDVIKKLAAEHEIELVIIGDGTTHKAAASLVEASGLQVKVVDEKHTT